MEGTPQEIDYEQIKKEIQVDGVLKIHDMHVWALTPQQWILTAHIVISKLTAGARFAVKTYFIIKIL